ncbi:CBS domain-containing protein [candidate division CSSED10-310 bacterium]|uniref:CBS domain-containing protein n=1 Tax=candidate division CSSED10-310 bacterium TaxID=2855610 RepID=A0ABV6YS34_UNCC1
MDIKRAVDVMIPLDNYPHMPYWFSIRQAIFQLEQFEFEIDNRKSMPRVVLIFNENYELLGMVRRRDILRALEPDKLTAKLPFSFKKIFERRGEPDLSETQYDRILKAIKERAERPVSDVMMPIKTTVDHDDNLVKVIYEIVENDLYLIPVLQDGELVGVIRTVEILHEVKKIILE